MSKYNNNNNVPGNCYTQKASFAGGEFWNNKLQNSFNEMNRSESFGINKYPITTNTNNGSNFNQTFQPNSPLIDPIDYKNKNNLLHNNVNEMVLTENIMEYRINIDSYDRNTELYPNPFNFIVRFNNGEVSDYGTIALSLTNVQYVKIDTIILPIYIHVRCPNDDSCRCHKPHKKSLLDDRFIILEIKELDTNLTLTYSTSDQRSGFPRGTFCIVVPDTRMGLYYTADCLNGNKMYKKNNLPKIKQFTIRLYDSYGKLLEPDPCTNEQIYLTLVVGMLNPDIATLPSYYSQ